MHEYKKPVHSQHAYCSHNNCDHSRKNCCITNRLTHLIHSSCSELLRGKNCNSCCNPHQESNNKERNGSSSAYRCQPLGSNKLSNNNCICHTVQLLKNISQKYRNSKIQQHFHGLSHSHICLHIQFSSIRKNIV